MIFPLRTLPFRCVGVFLIKLIFESEIIGDHRDELRIGRLSSGVLDGVAEVGI